MLGVAVCSHIGGGCAVLPLLQQAEMLDRGKMKLELSSRRKSSWSLVFWKPSELPAPKPGHRVTGWLCPFATSWPSPAAIPHALQGEALPLCCLLLEQWVIWVSSPGQHTHSHLGT